MVKTFPLPEKIGDIKLDFKIRNKVKRKINLIIREPVCAHCGIKADGLVSVHNKSSKEVYVVAGNVRLTWDHIVPKTLGGSNSVNNRQTLCTKCNLKKGSSLDVKFVDQVFSNWSNHE